MTTTTTKNKKTKKTMVPDDGIHAVVFAASDGTNYCLVRFRSRGSTVLLVCACEFVSSSFLFLFL
jgi:hypothetical protein